MHRCQPGLSGSAVLHKKLRSHRAQILLIDAQHQRASLQATVKGIGESTKACKRLAKAQFILSRPFCDEVLQFPLPTFWQCTDPPTRRQKQHIWMLSRPSLRPMIFSRDISPQPGNCVLLLQRPSFPVLFSFWIARGRVGNFTNP